MIAAVLRVRTCVIVLVLFLAMISVAFAANQTIILRLGTPTVLRAHWCAFVHR